MFHVMDMPYFVYPFINLWTFGCFYFSYLYWIMLPWTLMYMILHRHVFISLVYISRSKIAGSYDDSVFHIWRNCQSNCTIRWRYGKTSNESVFPFFSHLHQHLLFSILFIVVILVGIISVFCHLLGYFVLVVLCVQNGFYFSICVFLLGSLVWDPVPRMFSLLQKL